jgi:hypothetical protein
MHLLVGSHTLSGMGRSKVVDAVGRAAKAGAMLLALWGVLHVWVGAEGAHQYLANGTRGIWTMFLGVGPTRPSRRTSTAPTR